MLKEEYMAYIDYASIMHQRHSILEIIQYLPFKWPFFAIHPLQATDRLGNPDIDFPIGIVFGDSDFFGSEGADQIIRNNKHYKTGRSQLFKMKDSTHFMSSDRPKE